MRRTHKVFEDTKSSRVIEAITYGNEHFGKLRWERSPGGPQENLLLKAAPARRSDHMALGIPAARS